MNHYPASILNLIKYLSKLPGIGEKTAERLALHILHMRNNDARLMAQSILELKDKVRLCAKCYALSDSELCQICSDPSRETTVLCVVEQPADMVAIEKSGSYKGLYHILQGVLSPMDGVGPDDIRVEELINRIGREAIKEIVLATSTTLEGEATASFIAKRLKTYPVQVTRIASGVPIGGDLKYVDQVTLRRAMENRRQC
ncbi:MAG: recombination mediator RecR [Desulfobacterales bacterium]|nr:recombination mediator RecR [Desulfobacterales bacterium]MDD4071647.1 recombination mediator RecR [Desulfobacterales bacterium]MDD4391647.1 recombination mediator RecR [Desulfobacterales bacterium]